MKKSHLILLLAAAVLALSSAYSLAAINQVYNIGFEWFSQLEGRYEGTSRDVSSDRQSMPVKDIGLKFSIIDGINGLKSVSGDAGIAAKAITGEGLTNNVYIYCSLGMTDSPEFRIKVVDIAQRGNNLEIRLSINTPEASAAVTSNGDGHYRPVDIIRIKKAAFPTKGRLLAVFKNQDGIQLGEQYFEVR
jgi:hypothetical protein